MGVKQKLQIAFEDNRIDNPDILRALEERQDLKDELKTHEAEYKEADKKAREMIGSANLPMPCRVGRFILTEKDIEPKTVSFETKPAKRLNIKTIDED